MKTWNVVAASLALVLALLVATQPLYVLGLTLFDYGETPGGQYYTAQTKDTTRFPESDPAALSRLTAHAAYPPGANQSPSTVVPVPADNWPTAVAATQLRASADAAILIGDASAPNVTANANTTTVSGGNPAAGDSLTFP